MDRAGARALANFAQQIGCLPSQAAVACILGISNRHVKQIFRLHPVTRAAVTRATAADAKISAMDDQEFQRRAEASLQELKRVLIKAEESVDMEVEEQSGALHISFDDPPGRFVISPNSAVKQIWISALSRSFKLDWAADKDDWVLAKTGEPLKQLVGRLISEQSGEKLEF